MIDAKMLANPLKFLKPKRFTKTGRFKPNIYRLEAGFAWNPLTRYPRNKGCICGSGEKFKGCCLPTIKRAIRIDDALQIKASWKELLTGHVTIKPKMFGGQKVEAA